MAVTLAVLPLTLMQARADWDDTADALDAVWRRLARTRGEGASEEVVAAFEAFREHWVDVLKTEAQHAEEHAAALGAVGLGLTFADRVQAESLRGLLGWSHHGAPIVEGRR